MLRGLQLLYWYAGYCEGIKQRPGKKLWGHGDIEMFDKTWMIVPPNKWTCALCGQEISGYDTTTHHPHCYYNSFRAMMPE